MRTHTSTFKNNLKTMGKQITVKITYTIDEEEIVLSDEEINSIQPIVQGDILKSVMKELHIDSNVDIPVNTLINFQFGVYDETEEEYEYINYGNYYVTKSERQEDTRSYAIDCYDKMIFAMKDYTEVALIYPTTIRDYITELCDTIGLTFANASDTFANYDKEIPTDVYKNIGYTYRDVLDDLAEVTASFICINDNDELEIRYPQETNDVIDEDFFKEDNVTFKNKFGKVNSIVLTRSGESDSVYLQDEESVAEDGLCEVKIIDNQIMNFNDRSEFLTDILEQLDGLEYYEMDVASTGICYYEIGDKYEVQIGENTYPCLLLNSEVDINQGLEENIYVESSEKAETEYQYASKTDKGIVQATIIAKKNEGEIEALTSRTNDIETIENNNYQELLAKFDNIASTDDITTLQNLVRQIQTDTYTKTEIQQIASGVAQDGTEVSYVKTASATFDENGMHYEKSGANTSSTVNETGVTVTDTSGSTNSELLFAGYDATQQEALVRVANLYLTRYLGLANWRIEQVTDSTYGTGIGFFYLG